MRSIIILPLAAAALLSACDSGNAPKSQEEVSQEMANLERPTPGLYKSSSRIVSFEVPGMPPAQAEKMKGMFATSDADREFCLTKAEAEKGFEEMTRKLAEGNCTYDRFKVSGGNLDAKLTCETGKDMKSLIEMKGTMSSEGSKMTMAVNQSVPGGTDGSVKIVAEVASQRIGDCPGA